MKDKFDIVVADPCWSFNDSISMSDVKRGAAANYPTLDIEAIKALPVKEIVAKDAILALWVPSSLLQDGMDTMKSWGFIQKQIFVWNKTKLEMPKIDNYPEGLNEILSFGMGRLFRNCSEICLIGTRGKVYENLKNKSQRNVCFAQNFKHSQKPETLQNRLEIMFPNPEFKRLEMFARRKRDNWICLGNEIDGKDIRDALKELIDVSDIVA